MEVKDYQDGKMIVLSRAFDTRPKILNLFYFILFFAPALFFMNELISEDMVVTGRVITATASVILFVCAYRFCNKSVLSERCFVDKDMIVLTRQGLVSKKSNQYRLSKISGFNYHRKPKMADHPLNNKTFDVLGFQTQQAAINEMYGDYKISFNYDSKIVEFGDNLYSWDFEELVSIIKGVSGKNFNITED